MGKKRRGQPDIEEVLGRPWCYYCERDFEDLKLLISHQKAKHFKCERCGRRLNTAGGLSVHMNQVHKETLTQVENALPNRQGLDVEIFGMEGVPGDVLEQHRARVLQNYYAAQERRRIETGNPVGGQGGMRKRKELVYETDEELLKRFEHWRDLKRRGELPDPAAAAQQPEQQGDDIDQLIRMAEAGARPPPVVPVQLPTAVPQQPPAKKEKTIHLAYDDLEISPEEHMAKLPRYAFASA